MATIIHLGKSGLSEKVSSICWIGCFRSFAFPVIFVLIFRRSNYIQCMIEEWMSKPKGFVWHAKEDLNSKSLILKDSSVRSVWTCLTASPCYTTNANKHWMLVSMYLTWYFNVSNIDRNVYVLEFSLHRMEKSRSQYILQQCCFSLSANHRWWCGSHCHMPACAGWALRPDAGDFQWSVSWVSVGHAGGQDWRRQGRSGGTALSFFDLFITVLFHW